MFAKLTTISFCSNRKFVESGLNKFLLSKHSESLYDTYITGDMAECMTKKVTTDAPGLPSIALKNTKYLMLAFFAMIAISVFYLILERVSKTAPKRTRSGKVKVWKKRPKLRQVLSRPAVPPIVRQEKKPGKIHHAKVHPA